ncbi:hypothetical protein F5Y01DRAFT_288305, partial [Xylaria sp. FL0043]
MPSRGRKHERHEGEPKDHEIPPRPSSSDLKSNNTKVASSASQSAPPESSVHERGRSLSPDKTSTAPKNRRGSAPAANLHQPIGFACCHCQYRSSGSFCSNPHDTECPHKTVPRCRDCPIVFTYR